jgi:hypothetical protein
MSTARMVLVLLFLFIAFGIVGRMDYDDAKRRERAGSKDGIQLFCVRFPTDVSGERGPSQSRPAAALPVTVATAADIGVSASAVFRCVVVEE